MSSVKSELYLTEPMGVYIFDINYIRNTTLLSQGIKLKIDLHIRKNDTR